MIPLPLREYHASRGALFTEVNGFEVVDQFGEPESEYAALRDSVGIWDLSFRGRLCLLGGDRVRLLHGQVTNDVNGLGEGRGCYAAFVSSKGRMQADVFVYNLAQELLLDLEPGMGEVIQKRLEHFVVADDVQWVDVAPHYGLIGLHGPRALVALAALELGIKVPELALQFTTIELPGAGEVYLMNQPRLGVPGIELFVPMAALQPMYERLLEASLNLGGRSVGWQAVERVRIEAGIPRFGVDMDESNLPPEAGIAPKAISYDKGCYIGQEILARLRTYGQVTRKLRGLKILGQLAGRRPTRGDVLSRAEREVGRLTSVTWVPEMGGWLAMGYVRRESSESGVVLELGPVGSGLTAEVVDLPLKK
jgi:folate-binding protein YgfZ